MKFKHIAAAVALAAVSASSFAAIDGGNPSGNGEFVVVIYDADYSYTKDLGLFMTGAGAFDGNSSYTFALDSLWNDFYTASGSSTADLKFAVFAADGTGGTNAGGLNLFTTVNTSGATLFNNTSIGTATASVNAFGGAQLLAPNTTHPGAFAHNGDSYSPTGVASNFVTAGMDDFNNAVAVNTWLNSVAVGSDAVFKSFSRTAASGGQQTTQANFAGVWSVNQTGQGFNVTYSAVPDADGLALMLAGLGAMGFIARRRAAK